jgi:predicted dehydrogenase
MWLVGAGYWGSKLNESLKKFGVDAKIIDIKNGQTIADIDNTDPVILATPLWQHYEQTVELLNRGHDVYVEKPMAETAEEIKHIQQTVRPGQTLMVGHIFVHHPQMAQIKELLANDTIGILQHVTSRRLNWGIYQTKTDPILSLATHDISIVQELIGVALEVEQAQAYTYSDNQQPDRVTMSGKAMFGRTWDIDVSWHWPMRTRETVLIGTHGQIIWDQDANTITVALNKIIDRRAVADTAPTVIKYNYPFSPLEYELKHWVDCLQSKTTPITGVDQALAVAETIDQIKALI